MLYVPASIHIEEGNTVNIRWRAFFGRQFPVLPSGGARIRSTGQMKLLDRLSTFAVEWYIMKMIWCINIDESRKARLPTNKEYEI